MKVKFTQKEFNAIKIIYCNNEEGNLPCMVSHVPKQKEYQVLQHLWFKMADKINQKTIDKSKKK